MYEIAIFIQYILYIQDSLNIIITEIITHSENVIIAQIALLQKKSRQWKIHFIGKWRWKQKSFILSLSLSFILQEKATCHTWVVFANVHLAMEWIIQTSHQKNKKRKKNLFTFLLKNIFRYTYNQFTKRISSEVQKAKYSCISAGWIAILCHPCAIFQYKFLFGYYRKCDQLS